MPLYEFNCPKCETKLEKICRYSDIPIQTCPHCNGSLERIQSNIQEPIFRGVRGSATM